jgi:predicted dehydrogenase
MSGSWRFAWGVLVGYGVMGRTHASFLADGCDRLTIVELADEARARAAADHPQAEVVASLGEIGGDLAEAVGVIATWGPDHADVFAALVDRGCRRVLCEKPLADSVARAAAMVDRAETEGVALGVNYVRRNGREAEAVAALATRFDLGVPQSIVVVGGARGIVTNGIHLVEWACDVFEAEPAAATGTVRGEAINPRSAALQFYGGTAIWSFPGGRELVISYSLESSLREDIAVVFRDALIAISSPTEVVVRRRPPDEVAEHPAITRTGPASEVLYTGGLPGVILGHARTERALALMAKAQPAALRPQHHVRALAGCVAALEASATGRRVDLPISSDSELGMRRWPIT